MVQICASGDKAAFPFEYENVPLVFGMQHDDIVIDADSVGRQYEMAATQWPHLFGIGSHVAAKLISPCSSGADNQLRLDSQLFTTDRVGCRNAPDLAAFHDEIVGATIIESRRIKGFCLLQYPHHQARVIGDGFINAQSGHKLSAEQARISGYQ